jgi:GT2 family glycosyltransferase
LASAATSLGVVIPCHDNSVALSGVLRSLAGQATRPDRVVVVDDNSSAVEASRLKRLCEAHAAIHLRLAPPDGAAEALGRRSHARNAGSRRLDTDLILYLDGDMLLAPRYIEEIRRQHARRQGVYLRGRRFAIPAAFQRGGMRACLDRAARRPAASAEAQVGYASAPSGHSWRSAGGNCYYDRWDWCAGNNLSVRRRHAIDVGLWDERFYGWGEEDLDFSYRLHRHGLVPLFVAGPRAACFHLDHPVDRERNASTLRANARYLLSKFPQVAERRREAYRLYGIDVDALLG